MATMTRSIGWLLSAALAGCGDLHGFGGALPPLASIQVELTGNFAGSGDDDEEPALRVAVVWGEQWLPEPFCILPPRDARAARLIAVGCRDPFGFVPSRAGASAAIEPGGQASLDLYELPAADLMVGDLDARVAYASLVVYDDRNGDLTLNLDRARRLRGREEESPSEDSFVTSRDVVYGASFVRMTEPDTRLAFREGSFNPRAAFYPRRGCGAPLPGFSLVSAGGFSAARARAALARGELPAEDPATCRETSTDEPVTIALRAPGEVRGVACMERRTNSSTRYRQPPADMPDLAGRTSACAEVPDFGSGRAQGMIQLAISGRPQDRCAGLTHYVLRGCYDDALCEVPEWDITSKPPAWWPCPARSSP